MNILVGNTGLVGTTLQEHIQFDHVFNSKNIHTFNTYSYTNPTIYLTCLPASKWIVNQNIKSDIENIHLILQSISDVKFSKIILISTIDVYCDSPLLVDETYPINFSKLSYGTNRYLFERLVSQTLKYDDIKIFRLPALFNRHIKKNILFDLINENDVSQISLNTSFQWYNLDRLYSDIFKYISKFPNESVFNLFTEPIDTLSIIDLFPGAINKINRDGNVIKYNYTTKFDSSRYISTQQEVLDDIKKFINEINNF
jgi:hypothetical protein